MQIEGRHFKEGHQDVRGFTRYQICDLSDILLLEDHSDEHYTAKYPLIDVERGLEQHFLKLETVKPVCYQLSIE